jgi:spermidine/putrescine transport system ATP-binding protein
MSLLGTGNSVGKRNQGVMGEPYLNRDTHLQQVGDHAVEMREVVKRFGDVTAVDHVSIQVRDGEFFSLLGSSGCGKTTSLRLIAGFETASEGQVLIGGEPQGYLPPFKRPVNTVFQHYALFPHMDVFQNVAFGLQMQHVPKDQIRRKVMEALELVHLKGMERRRPRQLSGGQQQRVALARALVNHPKVLLLDEPLGALDLKLRKAMQLELKTLQEEVGITFIYVTHDQEEALTMSDRIAVMSKGRVLQVGTPQEIYETPSNRFVADFIGETNFLPGRIQVYGSQTGFCLEDGIFISCGWIEDGLFEGDRAVLSVRPEKIQLYSSGEEPPPQLYSMQARVEQVIYAGTDTRYLLRTREGGTLAVRQQNSAPHGSRFEASDPVQVCWHAEHARVLRA